MLELLPHEFGGAVSRGSAISSSRRAWMETRLHRPVQTAGTITSKCKDGGGQAAW